MARGSNAKMYPNPLNETNSGEGADTNDLYFSLQEVLADHLTEGDWTSTPNSRSGEGIMGGVAPGEPSVGGK